MRKNRAFLWLWDMLFFRGAIGRSKWGESPWRVSRSVQRQVAFRPWWATQVMRRTRCRFGHDWGWGREHRTHRVMLSMQSCGRCWLTRKTPPGSNRGAIWIEENEAEINEA